MGKPSQRRQAKQRARRQRVHRKQWNEAYGHKYPTINLHPKPDTPPGLVALVEKAKLKLSDPDVFPAWEREFFRLQHKLGVLNAIDEFKARYDAGKVGPYTGYELCHLQLDVVEGHLSDIFDRQPPWGLVADALPYVVGHRLVEQIPERDLARYFPFHRLLVQPSIPVGADIDVDFFSMQILKTRGGRAYYSSTAPTVEIDGQPRRVSFMGHAAERFCDRFVPPWKTYVGSAYTFELFDDKGLEFSENVFPDGQRVLEMWLSDDGLGSFSWHYARHVLNETDQKPDPDQVYSIKVGYLPFFLHGEHVVAKTLVFPWFRQTPEVSFIKREARMADHERESFLTQARAMSESQEGSLAGIWQKKDQFKVIRTLHRFQFPQAKRLHKEKRVCV